MRKEIPLKLGIESKSERGHRLYRNEPPPWLKPSKLALPADIGLEEGIRTIFSDAMMHWINNEAASKDGRHSEGVHQMRVGIRRLRSAITLLRPWLDAATVEDLLPRLRSVLKGLGQAREMDVFIEDLLDPLSETVSELADITELRSAAVRAQTEAYESVREMIDSRAYADHGARCHGLD